MFQLPLAYFRRRLGVIDVALLSVIRRWHFPEQISLREICRGTGLWNAIREYLRAGGVGNWYRSIP
jgi:hypothetical protein